MAASSSPSYDTVLHIMERVRDVVTLFRCAAACKGWRRLIMDDPSFIRSCLPEDVCRRSGPFPGFFAQLRPSRGAPTPCLVPAPRAVLGSYRRPLRSFIPNLGDTGFFDHAVPLVSRHGLLLVRLANADHHIPTSDVILAVCNLLTGTLDVLPRLEHDDDAAHDHEMTGYAILTSAADYYSRNSDDDHNKHHLLPTSFKVLVIGINKSAFTYRLRTFSSAGERRCDMCSGTVPGGRIDSAFMQQHAVVRGGTARWLYLSMSTYTYYRGLSYIFYTLDVSAESGEVFFTNLSINRDNNLNCGLEYEESYFSVDDANGRLTLIYMPREEGLQLGIWRWDYNGRFHDARLLRLKQPCVHLLMKDNHQRVYAADIRTGVMREVPGTWPHRCNLRRSKTVPLDMDWPALFVSQLGVHT